MCSNVNSFVSHRVLPSDLASNDNVLLLEIDPSGTQETSSEASESTENSTDEGVYPLTQEEKEMLALLMDDAQNSTHSFDNLLADFEQKGLTGLRSEVANSLNRRTFNNISLLKHINPFRILGIYDNEKPPVGSFAPSWIALPYRLARDSSYCDRVDMLNMIEPSNWMNHSNLLSGFRSL